MKVIEEFNHRLNKSVSKNNNDAIYLDQINTYLRMTVQQASKWENVCIIGAGRCRDIPLALFLDYYKNVVLTDVDKKSLEECIGKRRNLSVIPIEYTGFDEVQFFESFGERMWKAKTKEELDYFLKETIESVMEYQFLKEKTGMFDLVYVSPIYTQLIFQQTMLELQGLLQDGYDVNLAQYMQDRLLEEMPGIIERFNDNLVRLLDEDGILFVLSDVFEMETGSEFYRKVSHSIKNKLVMEEIYQNYQNKYGFGLGDYGLHDLTKKTTRIRTSWLLWNFSNTRSFAIHLHICKKNKGGKL